MSALFPTPFYLGFLLSLLVACAALFQSNYRRGSVERRISKGLRNYTGAQALSR
jgi:hypothetical protein